MEIMEDASTYEQFLMSKAVANNIPINGSIELLPLCNMKCDMCYVRLDYEEMKAQGRLRTVDEWMKVAREMKEAGTLFLLLTGGEPLLYPDFKSLYTQLRELGMVLTINTNGTLLDESWAEFFSLNPPRRINITLYGSDQDTYDKLCHYPGGFEKTINAIHLLKKYNVDVKVAVSAAKNNAHCINNIFDLGKELDVVTHVDTYMMPATRERHQPYDMQSRLDPFKAAKVRISAFKNAMSDEQFKEYVDQTIHDVENFQPQVGPHRSSCYAGRASFTINWQGHMRPCVILNKPEYSVFEESFIDCWHHISEHMSQIILADKCLTCSLRSICRTCAACALLEEGSYDAIPEYMCQYSQHTYDIIKKYKEEMKDV